VRLPLAGRCAGRVRVPVPVQPPSSSSSSSSSPLPCEPTVERLLVLLAERDTVIEGQAQAIEQLTGQVAALQARLGQNPRNSSRPPSSEGYAKPAPRSQRRPSWRRPGGQDGAPGTTLRQVAEPDRVLVHTPAVCGGCGAGLAGAPVVSCAARQVFDLPPIALQVTEHRLQHRRCGCGTVTMAGPVDGVPAGVGAPTQYGPGVRAVATYLAAAQHLPLARTADTLADLLGAPVSVGTVAAIVEQAAAGLGAFTTAVRGQLATSPVMHVDETGLRVDGALAWVHSASTSTSTLTQITVHPRRGIEAMQAAGVLPKLDGVAVHDGWKPYRHDDRDPASGRGVVHGLCNAHHLRELTAVTPSRHHRSRHHRSRHHRAHQARPRPGVGRRAGPAAGRDPPHHPVRQGQPGRRAEPLAARDLPGPLRRDHHRRTQPEPARRRAAPEQGGEPARPPGHPTRRRAALRHRLDRPVRQQPRR